MNTHSPIEHIQCHSVIIHILWMFMGCEVGGDGVVGRFIGGWVVGWVVEGFIGWVVVGWLVGGFMGWVGVW